MKLTVWKNKVKKECKEKRRAKRLVLKYREDVPVAAEWGKTKGGAK